MLRFEKIPDRAKGSLRETQEATGRPNFVPFEPFDFRGQPHIVLNGGPIFVRRSTGWTRQGELPGSNLSGWAVSKWVVTGERMFAVGNDGSVYELDGDQWKKTYQPPKDLPMWDGYLGYDESARRLVAWHVGTSSESSRDKYKVLSTWFFENGSWRKSAFAPPCANKDWYAPTLELDTGIGRLVRVWEKRRGRNSKATSGFRTSRKNHLPPVGMRMHDPASGQTLVLHQTTLHRFDLDALRPVADVSWDFAQDTHDYIHYFDPVRRVLTAEDIAAAAEVFELDLGPVFEAATKLGPRTAPRPAKPSTRKPSKASKPPTSGLDAVRALSMSGFFTGRELGKGEACIPFDWSDTPGDVQELIENHSGLEAKGGAAAMGLIPFAAIVSIRDIRRVAYADALDRLKDVLERIAKAYLFVDKKTDAVFSNSAGEGVRWLPKRLARPLKAWSFEPLQ